jgi:hypothetical protein
MKLSCFSFVIMFFISGLALQAGILQPFHKQKVSWPWVYPATWKVGLSLQRQSIFPADSGLKASFAPGIQADLVLNKNFLIGFSLDYLPINSSDSLSQGKIWKPGFALGFMVPLDDIDIHHLIFQLAPALSIGRFSSSRYTSLGYSLSLQYEYTLFSNNILSPGIFYNRFPEGNVRKPSIGRWAFGFRYIFGK